MDTDTTTEPTTESEAYARQVEGIAAQRRADRGGPGMGRRAQVSLGRIKGWDPRIWIALAAIVVLFLAGLFVRWMGVSMIDAQADGQVAMAEAFTGRDNEPTTAGGSQEQAAGLIKALGDPWKAWADKCLPSNHTRTVIGVAMGRDGKTVNDKLNPTRSWLLMLNVIALGPAIDVTQVYVGNDAQGMPMVSTTYTPDTPGLMCVKPVLPGATTTAAPKAAGS